MCFVNDLAYGRAVTDSRTVIRLWKGTNPVLVTYWIKPIIDTVGTSPFLVQLLGYSSGDVQLLIIRLNVVD